MRNVRSRFLLTFILVMAVPTAWACGVCIRSIMSPSEFDQRSWDSNQNVYVGVVSKAELSYPTDSMPVVRYTLQVDEVFKGNPDNSGPIQSKRTVRPWDSEVEEWVCGVAEVFVGDRLVVFSNPNESVHVGSCSATRVIETMNVTISSESRDTLERLRGWRSVE